MQGYSRSHLQAVLKKAKNSDNIKIKYRKVLDMFLCRPLQFTQAAESLISPFTRKAL